MASILKLRTVIRRCASPPAGMDQEWTEYQVVWGRTILSRHNLERDAIAEIERQSKSPPPDRC